MSRAARSAGAGPARLLRSVDPCDGRLIASHSTLDGPAVERRLARAVGAVGPWAERTPDERAALLGALADGLEERRDKLALLVTSEMGKRLGEARAEVDKCAWACRYYAEHASAWLADEPVETAATASWVSYRPLGVLLAVMPWNFPLWQVFRCVAPALAAGNAIVLKHASNVSLCALAIDSLCRDSGLPPGVVQTLLIDSTRVEALVTDPRIAAVSVTGSEAAGRAVAASAGRALKKCVLELGGSDPFVVLDDADLGVAVEAAANSGFFATGQRCTASSRIIVTEGIHDRFVA
ncbi:MAG: aldehyde dehydrogenase family protein, partial [Planctomycetes bacterium]|nr:aldehyde dehydrogenase family protein [Planctomycetota bacterium]